MLHIIETLKQDEISPNGKPVWREIERVFSDSEWRPLLERLRGQGHTVRSVHQDSERAVKCPACGMRGNMQTDIAHALFYWLDDEKYDGLTGYRIPKHVSRRDHCETCPSWGRGHKIPKKPARSGSYGQPVSEPAVSAVDKAELDRMVEQAIADRYSEQLAALEAQLEALAVTAATAAVQAQTPVRVEVVSREPQPTRVITEAMHHVVPKVVKALQAGVNVWLVGPTGTGKTTIAEQVARIMDLEQYEAMSLTTGTPVSEITGYMDANGNYQETGAYRVFTKGGLFLFDECDNGHPNTLGKVNAATSNGYMTFGNGMHFKHENAYFVASANTAGTGADSQYAGRNRLDAAFLKRFVHIDVPIDEALEAQVTRNICSNSEDAEWVLKAVREVRSNSERMSLPLTFSPRECYDTAKLLEAGFSRSEVVRMSIRKDVSAADWDKVTAGTCLQGMGSK